MIVITGADGFIGDCMVQYLSKLGSDDLVLVDKFTVTPVEPGHDAPKIASCPDVETFHETSLQTMRYIEKVPRDFFFRLGGAEYGSYRFHPSFWNGKRRNAS